jgi:hypothetical protein
MGAPTRTRGPGGTPGRSPGTAASRAVLDTRACGGGGDRQDRPPEPQSRHTRIRSRPRDPPVAARRTRAQPGTGRGRRPCCRKPHHLAAQLRVAAAVREAWWNWQRARADAATAQGQLDNAQRIAADVGKRLKAGDLAQADQHQADGAVAAAQATVAQAQAAVHRGRAVAAHAGGVARPWRSQPARRISSPSRSLVLRQRTWIRTASCWH